MTTFCLAKLDGMDTVQAFIGAKIDNNNELNVCVYTSG